MSIKFKINNLYDLNYDFTDTGINFYASNLFNTGLDLDSMNIYIVKENDNLWNIAKKYKTSVENIAKASVEDILSIKGINESLAINIKEILNKK